MKTNNQFKNKVKILFLLTIVSTFIISCKSLIEFDIKRYFFGFFFTLIIGLVGLILSFFNNYKNK